MTKLEKLREKLSSIDLDLYTENMSEDVTMDELDDKVHQLISEQEVIYYRRAIDYLKQEDQSLAESIELANDMGYDLQSINSELLATLVLQQRLQEAYNELRDELEAIIDED